jgi:hypothetical protein
MLMANHSAQAFSLFGGSYVQEQHSDDGQWNLARPDVNQVVALLRTSMWDEVMKSLRSALSLKKHSRFWS